MNQQKLSISQVTELSTKIVERMKGKHGFPLIKYNGESQEVLKDEFLIELINNEINKYINEQPTTT